jgi:hypothetical protein
MTPFKLGAGKQQGMFTVIVPLPLMVEANV